MRVIYGGLPGTQSVQLRLDGRMQYRFHLTPMLERTVLRRLLFNATLQYAWSTFSLPGRDPQLPKQ